MTLTQNVSSLFAQSMAGRNALLSFLLLLRLAQCALPPTPTCQPGDRNCVPPSPASAVVTGIYPIEVTSSLPEKSYSKNPFGALTTYTVQLAADSQAYGTCTNPSSITFNQNGLAESCTSGAASTAQGLYAYPQYMLVSAQGTILSVNSTTEPPLPANASFTVRHR